MKLKQNRSGFTLVEIMIVVAIIALLAAIAIPNLLRAKLNSNQALAQSTVRALSTAAESFATANGGNYPTAIAALTGATPPYINTAYCGTTVSGYTYTCPTMTVATCTLELRTVRVFLLSLTYVREIFPSWREWHFCTIEIRI
jgi:prepilin-type N-terminal cleavage/methylation domain-containing protein